MGTPFDDQRGYPCGKTKSGLYKCSLSKGHTGEHYDSFHKTHFGDEEHPEYMAGRVSRSKGERHDDYLYLRAWNKMLQSDENWNVSLARKQKAPQDVVYYKDGTWVRASDEMHERTREQLEAIVAKMRSEEWRSQPASKPAPIHKPTTKPAKRCGADMPYDNKCRLPKGHPGEHIGMSAPTGDSALFTRFRDARAKVQERTVDPANRHIAPTVGSTTTPAKPEPATREGPKTPPEVEFHQERRIREVAEQKRESARRTSQHFMARQDDESRGHASERAGRWLRLNLRRIDREESKELRTHPLFRPYGMSHVEAKPPGKIERN